MPAFPDLLAMAAAAFGAATWVIPWTRCALGGRKPPHTSLAAVSRAIGFVMLAGCFSVAGLLLALLAFVFAERTGWAWLGLGAIVGFWLALAVWAGISRPPPSRRERDAS